MTGPEHYREAVKSIQHAQNSGDYPEIERIHLAYAQVHATLALAAATAMPVVLREEHQDVDGVNDWAHVIAPKGVDVFAEGDAGEAE